MSDRLMHVLQQRSDESNAEELEQLRAEWTDAFTGLVADVRAWVAPYVDKKLLRVKSEEVEVWDDRLGHLVLPALTLFDPKGIPIFLKPGPRFVVGGNGRADLTCGPRAVAIVRDMEGTWMLVRDRQKDDLYPVLTQDSFEDVLAELLQ